MDVEAQQGGSFSTRKPILLHVRSSKVFILINVASAVFTDTFFYTLIIPILPNLLENRADVPPDQAQKWISILLSVYALTNLIVSPLAGFVTDRSGSRKTTLLGGVVLMIVSTTLFAFGRTPVILLVARALQGASAAIIRVGGLALITDTFEAGKSGSALGWQSIGMFLGTFLGPPISGVLYDHLGIRAVFGVAYCILAVDLILRLLMIERKDAMKWEHERDDGEESEALLHPSRETGTENATANDSSQKTNFPILKLLKDRRLLSALWATFTCAIIMTALESVMPLYTMNLFSWTPTQAGFLIVTLSISVVMDPILGSLTDKYGSRWFSIAGFVLLVVVYIPATAITHDTTRDKAALCVLLVALGFAIGAISTPNMVEISLLTNAAEKNGKLGQWKAEQVMGQAYATLSIAYQLGSLLGPAWGGFLLISRGWPVMALSFAVLSGISAVVMFCFAALCQTTILGGMSTLFRDLKFPSSSKFGTATPDHYAQQAAGDRSDGIRCRTYRFS